MLQFTQSIHLVVLLTMLSSYLAAQAPSAITLML